MKKGRRLLLGLAILLLGLQMACATAEQNETAAYQANEIRAAEAMLPEEKDGAGRLDEAPLEKAGRSNRSDEAPLDEADGAGRSDRLDEMPLEKAGGAEAALLDETDRTKGALPVPAEGEEAFPTRTEDAELLGSPVKETGISEDGTYAGKEEVSLYLHLYNHLPDNYITKKEAKKLGWDSSKGNLWDVAPGKSIGGDYFGNYEGLLPEDEDRDYFECDIDYEGGRRNAKRIIYSDDGLIFYTEDHYETFEQLYGNE